MALPGGVSLEVFRSVVNAQRDDVEDLLTGYLAGAAGFAANFTRRVLVAEQDADDAPVAKPFRVDGGTYLRVPDPRDITTITIDGSLLTAADYVLRHTPFSHTVTATAIAELPAGASVCEITARWGFLTLPEDLVDAVYAHAARNYREREARFADSVDLGAGEGGGALYSYFRQLPPRVQSTYSLYRVAVDQYGVG
jgi:hypothetical protein